VFEAQSVNATSNLAGRIKKQNMRTKSIFLTVSFILSATITIAQNNKSRMTDSQKAQAAKADVYIINSKKKITDSLTTKKDTTAIAPKKKNCVKPNKKSS